MPDLKKESRRLAPPQGGEGVGGEGVGAEGVGGEGVRRPTTTRRPSEATWRRWLLLALFALAAIAAVRILLAPRPGALTEDELDYLRAAVHLAREGVLWHGPIEDPAGEGDAYREPGYSAALAATWRMSGVDLGFAEDEFAAAPGAADARRAAATLHLALLGVAAAAAAGAVAGLGGGEIPTAVAAIAVLASPALVHSSSSLASENLAVPLVAIGGAALVATVGGAGVLAPLVGGLASGLLPLVRGAGIVAAPVGIALLLIWPRALGRRARALRVGLFALPALLLPGLWMTRNLAVVGHPVIADRGGVVLQVRLELDRQLAEEGLVPAFLEWTPLAASGRLRERVAPDSRLSSFRWHRDGNYFTRAIGRWRARLATSRDPIEVDRALRREAVAGFFSSPGEHLAAIPVVGWRGLFTERSPAAAGIFDLRLPIGLGLLAGCLLLLLRGLQFRDPRPLALLALPIGLFVFHAGATEFLPRFGLPGLPLVWAATVAALAGLPAKSDSGPGPGLPSGR
ncbi:MAG TPA: hypothetical protein VMT85_03405 [Thermoanaerobaculia bacterium]|nr:hypothetical protein [Thermoanaerobaculia bacterium]